MHAHAGSHTLRVNPSPAAVWMTVGLFFSFFLLSSSLFAEKRTTLCVPASRFVSLWTFNLYGLFPLC